MDLEELKEYKLVDYFKEIVKFQKERDILNEGSNDFRRISYQFEEIFESLGVPDAKTISKSFARSLLFNINQGKLKKDTYIYIDLYELDDEDIKTALEKYKSSKRPKEYYERVQDAIVDSNIYNDGESAKNLAEFLPEEDIALRMAQYLMTVVEANKKKGNKIDSIGQVIKDENFQEPKLFSDISNK